MRRLSVSTTASRINIRGRSAHRRGAEVLMGVEANKGDGTLVVQTVSFVLLLCLVDRVVDRVSFG